MLYALDRPLAFVVLLVSTVVALALHGWLTALLTARTGDRSVLAEGRGTPDPRRQVDPMGFIGALVGGVGWSRGVPPPPRRRRGAVLVTTLVPALVLVGLGLVALVAWHLQTGLSVSGSPSTLLVDGSPGPIADLVLLLVGVVLLYDGLLALVPLLPLAGGRLLFALAPRTRGWQQAEHQLGERNIGTVVLLALCLFAFSAPLLFAVLDAVGGPLAALVTRG